MYYKIYTSQYSLREEFTVSIPVTSNSNISYLKRPVKNNNKHQNISVVKCTYNQINL